MRSSQRDPLETLQQEGSGSSAVVGSLSALRARHESLETGTRKSHPILRTYPCRAAERRAAWAFLKAIRPQASCSGARWFSGFFDQRMSGARLRFSEGVAGFNDPAPGAPAGHAELERDLLAAAADVRRQPPGDEKLARLPVVVGGIEAEALWRPHGRLGPRDGERLESGFQELVVVAVGTVTCQPERHPPCLAEKRTFRPFLARSVGLGPVSGPPSGALVIAPSAASRAQSMPTAAS